MNPKWRGLYIGKYRENNVIFTYAIVYSNINGLYNDIPTSNLILDFRDTVLAVQWYIAENKDPFRVLQWLFRMYDYDGR